MRGLYLAEAAMLTQQAKLNVISHNLANVKTAGYKRDEPGQLSFSEWMICSYQEEVPPILGSIPHSVVTADIFTDLTPGTIEETGRELDFALDNGYFTIQGPEGLIYTRNGRFFLNEEGYLVTVDNLEVLGEGGPINLVDREIAVDGEGTIFSRGQPAGRLRITFFPPEVRLGKTGYNYLRALNETTVDGQEAKVYWRCLENSNVDLTREMVAMLQVRRNYEAAQKVMTSCDQLLNRAANELGALS